MIDLAPYAFGLLIAALLWLAISAATHGHWRIR